MKGRMFNTTEDLAKRRMDIEEESAIDVPTSKLAEVCLIPPGPKKITVSNFLIYSNT